jgi:hypothetical protein
VQPLLNRNREIAVLGRVYRLVHSNPASLSNVVVSDVDRIADVVNRGQDAGEEIDDIV